MKVELSHEKFERLSSIAEGDTFYYKNELYIKTNITGVSADTRAVVRLSDGILKYLFDDDFIIPEVAKVIIE